jgi:hypothetical protein
MSLLTNEHRLSAKRFAAVPALLDLPEIQREPASVSNVSSRSSIMRGGVDPEEGCLITKSVKYTHQLLHMVDAVRSGDPQPIVSQKGSKRIQPQVPKLLVTVEFLKIMPYAGFTLED